MKKIILTTTHTAPYIDLWVDALEKEFEVDIFYVYRISKEKKWEQYSNTKGSEYANYSFIQKIATFKKCDFVMLGGWHIFINILLCFVLIPFKTKVAFFCDYPVIETTKTHFIMRLLKRTIMNSANYIFAASESCKDYIQKTYKIKSEKMRVFPYAHSLPASNIDSINKIRTEKLQLSTPVNLFIANNFLKRKGFHVITNALNQLDTVQIGQIKIRIAGTGENFNYYHEFLQEINPQIELLGWIEREQYEKEMDNCDVFLHASIFEPFGIPPLDAMQRGKYIIVSDGVKSMSHFRNMKNKRILFYSAHDSTMLAGKLRYVINNKKDLYENYEETIDMVNQSYSIENNINAIKSVFL